MVLLQLRAAVRLFLLLTALTGVVYPGLVTLIAGVCFPNQAGGSLIVRSGHTVGSALIGQPFSGPKYFWGRPSATTPPYNAAASGGSNLGPTSTVLLEQVRERVRVLRAADPGNDDPVPVDLVTASGSGLDPHISPEAAGFQVRRIARSRGMDAAKVRLLLQQYTEPRQLGLLGEPRVNVLRLNLALDEAQ
jgi:K+-transporting ATPase ATPase C chain